MEGQSESKTITAYSARLCFFKTESKTMEIGRHGDRRRRLFSSSTDRRRRQRLKTKATSIDMEIGEGDCSDCSAPLLSSQPFSLSFSSLSPSLCFEI
ncbi:hypothetical protein CsSME_00021779 [Camellia sinensis var. sinensis]